MVNGQNQQTRNEMAQEFQGGTIHLLDSSNAVSDSDTSLTSNASVDTADDVWSISHDSQNGTTTLQNTSAIEFGAVNGFVVDQIVLESTETNGNYLIESAPSNATDLSGDGETTIESGNFTNTFGE